jgi:hypothetical protein
VITAAEKIKRARDLIQKARNLPVPPGAGKYDLSYMAQVKDMLRQAKDLVKFIPRTVGVAPEIKAEAKNIIAEADQAGREIFRGEYIHLV